MGKHQHSFSDLRTKALQKLENEGFETEYLVLADANTLHFLDDFNQAVPMVVLIASKLESVRLIDNLRI
jgi:pantothenate synthetase